MKHGFKPLFKPRLIEYHGMFRKLMLRDFKRNRKLYRQRGIGEAIFGVSRTATEPTQGARGSGRRF